MPLEYFASALYDKSRSVICCKVQHQYHLAVRVGASRPHAAAFRSVGVMEEIGKSRKEGGALQDSDSNLLLFVISVA